jgi:hypothetical protein
LPAGSKSSEQHADDRARGDIRLNLVSTLEAQPVHAGVTHAAEHQIVAGDETAKPIGKRDSLLLGNTACSGRYAP